MDWLTRVRKELPEVTGDFRHDTDVQEEFAAHCAARQQELEQAGASPTEAERQVLNELQATARRKRALHTDSRLPMWSWPRHWFRQSVQDTSYAFRLLVRTPTATLASIATLALTIGATTAIFSVVQAVLLRPLPFAAPDRLVRVFESSPQGVARNVVSAGNYLAWTERTTAFDALGTFRGGQGVALTATDGTPEKLNAASITPSVLDVLKVSPAVGPGFTPGTFTRGERDEVMLSDALWQRRFGGSSDVLGTGLTLDGAQVTVVGVMPPTFLFPSSGIDLWFAHRFAATDRDSWTSHNYNVIARLTPTISLDQAQQELTALAATLAIEHPAEMSGWGVNLFPAHADAVRGVRPLLMVLMGVVFVVLLIACANLATLQLARASRRHLEMAVRSAIGAGRVRLVRQLLTETLLMTAVGGALGLAVLSGGLKALVAAAPADIPFLDAVRIDGGVLTFTLVVTLGCAILVGLVPALMISRGDLRPLLASSRIMTGGTETRLRHGLVAVQAGLALVLLVVAGLLIQSSLRLQAVAHGFDPRNLLTVSLELPQSRYVDTTSQHIFYSEILTRLRATPGIVAVAGTSSAPAEGAGMTFSFAIEGRRAPNPNGREDALPLQSVTPGYFETMGIPVLEGRSLAEADRADTAGVLVVNEALARRHWPNGGAVGSRIRFREAMPWITIIGVVGDTRDEGLDVAAPPTLYVPFSQRPDAWAWLTWQTLVIRTAGEPMGALPAVRATIWDIDRDLPLFDVQTMEDAFAGNESRRRFVMTLSGAFALLALGLAAVGVFGVLSCTVDERRKEIGIRIALGADPARVASSMIRTALAWTLAGVATGAAAALLVTRFLQSLLFDVEPTDQRTFAAMMLLLLLVAVAAAWLPARRAARASPVSALRDV